MRKPHRPTAIKILQGEPNKDRINYNEPQPEGTTTVPRWLNRQAKTEWKRIVPELYRLGLLTKIDRSSLAAYCQAYGRWVQVENKINALIKKQAEGDEANAYLLKTQAGNIIISPLLSVANRCLDQMKTFLVEFGMTPISRTRLEMKPEDKKDDMENLLNEVPMSER